MRRLIILFVFLFSVFNTYSQNWTLINTTDKYNYKTLNDNFLTINNLAVGTYYVVVRDVVGCEFRVKVIIEESLFAIPNVFTPNNDGKNETFFVENLPKEGAYLRVSNRWGKTVFETSNYQNDWKAEGLSEGVYFYILQIPNKEAVTGNVQIWR